MPWARTFLDAHRDFQARKAFPTAAARRNTGAEPCPSENNWYKQPSQSKQGAAPLLQPGLQFPESLRKTSHLSLRGKNISASVPRHLSPLHLHTHDHEAMSTVHTQHHPARARYPGTGGIRVKLCPSLFAFPPHLSTRKALPGDAATPRVPTAPQSHSWWPGTEGWCPAARPRGNEGGEEAPGDVGYEVCFRRLNQTLGSR